MFLLRWLRQLFKNGESQTSTILSDDSDAPLIVTVDTAGKDLHCSFCAPAHGESSPGLLQSPFEAGRPVNADHIDVCDRTLYALSLRRFCAICHLDMPFERVQESKSSSTHVPKTC